MMDKKLSEVIWEDVRKQRKSVLEDAMKATDAHYYCEKNAGDDKTEQERILIAKAFLDGWGARQKDVDEVLKFLEEEIMRLEKEDPAASKGISYLHAMILRKVYYAIRLILLRDNRQNHDTDICSSLGQE